LFSTYFVLQSESVNFGTQRNAWIYRRTPFPEDVYRESLRICIDRYTVTGVAAVLRMSIEDVQAWRVGRRRAKPKAQAAVVLLAMAPTKAVEALWERMEDAARADLTALPAVDRPVKRPKRTPPVVVSLDYEI
jgi:hypothetical protein